MSTTNGAGDQEPTSGSPDPGQGPEPAAGTADPVPTPVLIWQPLAPPAPHRRRRTALIIAGVMVPVLAVLAIAGFALVPRVLDVAAAPGPTASRPTAGNPRATGPEPPPLVPTMNVAMPAVGTCYAYARVNGFGQIDRRADAEEVVPCDQAHGLETIAVAPLDDSSAEVTATVESELYERCDAAATEFLGVPYRSTLTLLSLAMPGPAAQRAGAHWYRCDLAAIGTLSAPVPTAVRGSLKGHAEPITCLTWNVLDDATRINGFESIDCDTTHNGELVDVVWIPDGIDRTDHDTVVRAASDLCDPAAQSFLDEATVRDDLNVWMWPINSDAARLDWNVLCMVSTADLNERLAASIEGIGAGPLPVT